MSEEIKCPADEWEKVGNPFGDTLLDNVSIFTDSMQGFPYPGEKKSLLWRLELPMCLESSKFSELPGSAWITILTSLETQLYSQTIVKVMVWEWSWVSELGILAD